MLQTECLYPPEIHMVKADAQSDGILMRLWETTRSVSGALMNGVNGLTEGTPESSLTPSPYGDPATGGHREPGSGPSADTEHTGTRI